MYRVGKNNNAHSHGTYIRPTYVEAWNEMERQAERKGVSVSAFLNYALFYFMTGQEPSDSPLTGRTPISHTVPVYSLPEQRRRELLQMQQSHRANNRGRPERRPGRPHRAR